MSTARHRSLVPPRRVAVALLAAAAAVLAVIHLADRPDGRLRLTVLDCGGGSAVLVQTRDGDDVLVGTGTDPQKLATALGRVLSPARRSLDAVVLAGADRQVTGGAAGLADHYAIRSVIALTPPTAAERTLLETLRESGAAIQLDAGRAFEIGGLTLMPVGGTAPGGAALLLGDDAARALLLGDVAAADQEELTAITPVPLTADVVIGPPRGGIALALLAAAQPREVAVVGGSRDPISWPPARVRRTGVDGDLAYVADTAGFTTA